LGTGYYGWLVRRNWVARNLRIYFTAVLTNPERKAARIIQALDLMEAPKKEGYMPFLGSQCMEIHHPQMMHVPDKNGW
jgi:hypothetical protein